jgi:phosphoenolpyruvate-protein phosphotransferase (PTS system enzyme I)
LSTLHDGIPAASGIVIAPARVLRWEVPRVPHGATIGAHEVERETTRFVEACEYAKARIRGCRSAPPGRWARWRRASSSRSC